MHMGLSHVRHTYFMMSKFTKSILRRGNVAQTVLKGQRFKVKVGL